MNKYSMALAALLVSASASAQHKWTLQECIKYAVEHNISIKQQGKQCERYNIELNTSRNSRLPDLSASANENFSFGRGTTSDNTYINKNTMTTSFSLGTSVPLFTGFSIPNQIKLDRLELEAATHDLEKAKNSLSMEIARAYVELLYDKEMILVAQRQIDIDSAQVHRMSVLYQNGKASNAEVSQMKSTLSQSKLTYTQAVNNYNLELLTLSQLLELPDTNGFDIAEPNTIQAGTAIPAPEVVFAEASMFKPEIKAEELRLKGTEHSIKIAQAALYPHLNFSAGLGTSYYKVSGFSSNGFGKQLEDNFSPSFGFSLNIPIFNRFSTRNNVRLARLSQSNQQLVLDNAKKTLYKEIQTAYCNAKAAESKFAACEQAVKSNEDAFALTKGLYENGKANNTEFDTQKNKLLAAQSDLAKAKFEYLYLVRLIDFYRGKELAF